MTNKTHTLPIDELYPQLASMLSYMQEEAPLVHCITNPISINDCANILLAIGARPIMAEHPDEAAEITAISKALALNLGNITDVRMASMKISAKAAKGNDIPFVLDLVGLACSQLRRKYAKELLSAATPNIIKGNISELRALLGLSTTPGMGIEAGQKEMVTAKNALEYARIFQEQAQKHHTVLLATGPIDLAVAPNEAYAIANGTHALASITGTGCMNNVLAGASLAAVHGLPAKNMQNQPAAKTSSSANAASTSFDIAAAILSCLLLGIAGEKSHALFVSHGPGSFHAALMDSISRLTVDEIAKGAKISRLF